MKSKTSLAVRLGGRRVVFAAPAALADDLAVVFGEIEPGGNDAPSLEISANHTGTYNIVGLGDPLDGVEQKQVYAHVVDRVIRGLIADDRKGLALHAGLASIDANAVLIAGPTGAGKTSLVAWFGAAGFSVWTDELLVVENGGTSLLPFRRALVAKNETIELISRMRPFERAPHVVMSSGHAIALPPPPDNAPQHIRMVVLPRFERGAALSLKILSPGEATFHLMAANLNARNFGDGGLTSISNAIAGALCVEIHYGDYAQLDGDFAALARAAVAGRLDSAAALTIARLSATSSTVIAPQPAAAKVYPIPAMTPPIAQRKLTIAMTTYDDFDGVYFSIQSMRLFHGDAIGDAEFLVIDNNPDGIAASALKDLEKAIPNYRYYPYTARRGTIVRDHVFEIASGKYVLCMDCHVMFVPGSIQRLMNYLDANPDTIDLLQGPLIYDRLDAVSTHFDPKWSGGMWGQWATDERGVDPDGAPFDIPMQGVGALACRREAWPGYNPMFRGFGAEEGYIHEKFRQNGGRTLCLPFLRWLHRFQRPRGVSYPNRWEDRIFNYITGFNELGLPVEGIIEHYRELLGANVADKMIAASWLELQQAGVGIGDARARREAIGAT